MKPVPNKETHIIIKKIKTKITGFLNSNTTTSQRIGTIPVTSLTTIPVCGGHRPSCTERPDKLKLGKLR